MTDELHAGDTVVVLGLGLYGRAIATALVARGMHVVALEDRPSEEIDAFAESTAIDYAPKPDPAMVEEILTTAVAFFPSPGVPERHIAFELADRLSLPILSEFDLARWWDDRPVAAITGTDGKTTVTLLTVAMLRASGVNAVAVGNTEVPLIASIDDPDIDVFVVEASSFRLAHTSSFSPHVAAWLNWGPDHLDVHIDLDRYERSKARVWADLAPDGLAIAYAADPVVMRNLPETGRVLTVGTAPDAGATVAEGRLVVDGVDVASVTDLPRAFDHDVTNTLFAAAIALEMGASVEGIRSAIANHEMPPHRIQYVATIDEVAFYNDSKATVPHAVVTAIESFDSVVLIAGGRNKGLDLTPIAEPIDRVRAVVAIGEAAAEVEAAFAGRRPLVRAVDLDDAVRRASALAESGDVVLLSPGCASYDSHRNYGARGDDFMRAVAALTEEATR
ncbi:MAG: UDP-N-acetylmuramoyl-L-alanine--D-glutamate ligase [Acidimicrobiales bacterium]